MNRFPYRNWLYYWMDLVQLFFASFCKKISIKYEVNRSPTINRHFKILNNELQIRILQHEILSFISNFTWFLIKRLQVTLTSCWYINDYISAISDKGGLQWNIDYTFHVVYGSIFFQIFLNFVFDGSLHLLANAWQ